MMSLFAGYGFPSVSNASLLCEISSISLNYKDVFKDARDTPLGIANQLTFLVTFTIFRVFLFPLLVYYCLLNSHATIHYVSFIRQFCGIMTCVMSMLVTLLQFYWYRLILKGLVRLIQGIQERSRE